MMLLRPKKNQRKLQKNQRKTVSIMKVKRKCQIIFQKKRKLTKTKTQSLFLWYWRKSQRKS